MSLIRSTQGTSKAQSTLEYAIFITVVAAAVATMSTYVRRSIQANFKSLEERVNAESVRK